ncbi:MAG TPA: CdaR family protein [Mobilitalea sp.]|nr:CdaR family protein [Mobilitalea sp.]
MKEKLTRNIGLKVLSIVLAALLWLIITNVDDPIVPKQFRNVPVEILNENAISKLNQFYDITEGETIDFTVEARRTIADDLTVSDFDVTADFADLSVVNAVPINITSRYGSEVVVTDGKNQTMKVSMEPKTYKDFKVDVVQKGKPAEGFYVGEKTASPNIIQVTGPKSRIDKIAEVVVDVDVTGVTGPYHTIVRPKVLDANGKEIDASKLIFSEEYINVNIVLYKTKKIDLQVSPTGQPAHGYVITKVEFEPKSIVVAGADNVLNSTAFISIPESIAGATSNIEKQINLDEALPEGLVLVGEDKTAVVNITIDRLVTSDITVLPGDIEVRNKPEGTKVSFNTVDPVTVSIAGPSSLLEKTSTDTLKPFIDLTNYSIGTYTLPIRVEMDPSMTLANNPMVNISITQ